MNHATLRLPSGSKQDQSPFQNTNTVVRLHRVLTTTAREVGRQMEQSRHKVWEGQSLDGEHLWSRNDLVAIGAILQCLSEAMGRSGLDMNFSLDNEEVPLAPLHPKNGTHVVNIVDPIDGSKAFDNFKLGSDVPLPRPSSAISVATACPVLDEVVATALYCFDLEEVYSSFLLGPDDSGTPQYASFRNGTLLRLISECAGPAQGIEARRRVLNGDYNSRALLKVAQLNLLLMDRGMKPSFGGLAGSSAIDIVNVVRGSFAASIDVRALCGEGGSVLCWYDVAGALPIARGRGLVVHVTDERGRPLRGGNLPARTPVAYVVARADAANAVVSAIRELICHAFASGPAPLAAVR